MPDDQTRVIGSLRIGHKLYNVYLNEADEWSRRLSTVLAEWALERHEPVPEQAEAMAHSLAGSSATVGFESLSHIARALEHAIESVALHQQAAEPPPPSRRNCSCSPPTTSDACCTSSPLVSSRSPIPTCSTRCTAWCTIRCPRSSRKPSWRSQSRTRPRSKSPHPNRFRPCSNSRASRSAATAISRPDSPPRTPTPAGRTALCRTSTTTSTCSTPSTSICSRSLPKRRWSCCLSLPAPCASGSLGPTTAAHEPRCCATCTPSKAVPAWRARCDWVKWRTGWKPRPSAWAPTCSAAAISNRFRPPSTPSTRASTCCATPIRRPRTWCRPRPSNRSARRPRWWSPSSRQRLRRPTPPRPWAWSASACRRRRSRCKRARAQPFACAPSCWTVWSTRPAR